jgi:hypothetical protein
MEYIKEVEHHIIQTDKYLKELLLSLSPLYKKEHGEYQYVTVPLFRKVIVMIYINIKVSKNTLSSNV